MVCYCREKPRECSYQFFLLLVVHVGAWNEFPWLKHFKLLKVLRINNIKHAAFEGFCVGVVPFATLVLVITIRYITESNMFVLIGFVPTVRECRQANGKGDEWMKAVSSYALLICWMKILCNYEPIHVLRHQYRVVNMIVLLKCQNKKKSCCKKNWCLKQFFLKTVQLRPMTCYM